MARAELLVSLICDVLFNVVYFAVMMASFVLGISLGFNLMEETGYLARISFLFDPTMSKVGLQGKTIMPFFMGLGCTIAGTTGTRVVDNWGQRDLGNSHELGSFLRCHVIGSSDACDGIVWKYRRLSRYRFHFCCNDRGTAAVS